MIDIDDLQQLRICEKCNCVYMPQFLEEAYTYSEDRYPKNGSKCERCEPL